MPNIHFGLKCCLYPNALLKLSKMTSPQKPFDYDCIMLYKNTAQDKSLLIDVQVGDEVGRGVLGGVLQGQLQSCYTVLLHPPSYPDIDMYIIKKKKKKKKKIIKKKKGGPQV